MSPKRWTQEGQEDKFCGKRDSKGKAATGCLKPDPGTQDRTCSPASRPVPQPAFISQVPPLGGVSRPELLSLYRCSVALASTELGIQALAEHLCVLVSMRWLRQWGLCWGTGVQGSPAVQTPRPQQLYLLDGVCIRLHSRSPTEPQSLGMKGQPSYRPLGQQRARSPPSFSQESLPRVAPQAGAHSVRPSHTHLPRVVPSPLPALPLVQ